MYGEVKQKFIVYKIFGNGENGSELNNGTDEITSWRFDFGGSGNGIVPKFNFTTRASG